MEKSKNWKNRKNRKNFQKFSIFGQKSGFPGSILKNISYLKTLKIFEYFGWVSAKKNFEIFLKNFDFFKKFFADFRSKKVCSGGQFWSPFFAFSLYWNSEQNGASFDPIWAPEPTFFGRRKNFFLAEKKSSPYKCSKPEKWPFFGSKKSGFRA